MGGALRAGTLALLLPALASAGTRETLRALPTASGGERALMLRSLGREKGRTVREALLSSFDVRHGDPVVSGAAAEALGRVGGPAAAKALLDAWYYLQKTKLELVTLPPQLVVLRERIFDALCELRDPEALPAIRRGLIDDDGFVVERAMEGAAALKDAPSLEWLLRHSAQPPENRAQAALEALGAYSAPRAEEALRAALSSSTATLQAAAAYGLARSKKRIGILKLEGFLEEEAQASPASVLAAYYLLKLGRKEGLDYLVRLADDDASSLRLRALEALGKAGDERAVPVLSARLEREGREGRILIAAALGRLGGKRAVVALKLLQDDPLTEVAQAARFALAEAGEYDAQ